MSKVPVARQSMMMPMSRPTSPMRVVTKAFLAASAADRFSFQKPMSKYEQKPTPSQAM